MKTMKSVRNANDVLEQPDNRYNLSATELIEQSIIKGEGRLASNGALTVSTGTYTGRSPHDKFIVNEDSVRDDIDWGPVNRPLAEEHFRKLHEHVLSYLEGRECYVFDGFAGNDPLYRLPLRVINEYAWQNLFARQLFIRPSKEELRTHEPAFTIIAAPGCKAVPEIHGTNSETFIVISFEKRLILIGGTEYAGEIKKSVFSIMNYLLPKQNVLSMHCSANLGKENDVALFFGLSGTGKTTLSADPNRRLIGDDEHGWSDNGIFNIEGGCYAKCIHLSPEKEPQIWGAIRHGAVLENVMIDPETREADYDNGILTENTRAAYPIDHIPHAVIPGTAGHAKTILFLTADAFGVLPPISKLTKEQAMYHFLSGYTSKLAGTERGITEPEATFSTCFGAPFLPLKPHVYAEMLGEKIDRHQVNVFLVNTGWTGGAYGSGERMKLAYTRAMVTAALEGKLNQVQYTTDPVFGVSVPVSCPGVPDALLQPKNTWTNPDQYDRQARELARRFRTNFDRFSDVSETIKLAGPKC